MAFTLFSPMATSCKIMVINQGHTVESTVSIQKRELVYLLYNPYILSFKGARFPNTYILFSLPKSSKYTLKKKFLPLKLLELMCVSMAVLSC